MKHTTMMTVALSALVLSVGCTKDGKFNPGEKISKIYEQEEGASKVLTEQWNWDGSKLTSINSYSDGTTIDETVTFEYDGSQLSKVSADAENHYDLNYDGRKIDNIKIYRGNTLEGTMTFKHDGSKISEIAMTYSYDDEERKASFGSMALQRALWNTVMPIDADAYTSMEQLAAKGGAKANETITISLEWDGKNVSKVTLTSGQYKSTIEYTYDDKKNPYRNFIYTAIDDGLGMYSKNNVLTEKETYDGGSDTTTYTYTYDGKWPASRKSNNSQRTTYYEYK